MKMLKKLTAIALAFILTMMLSATAFAVSETDVTIKHAVDGATYYGYKLMSASTSLRVPGCHAADEQHVSLCYDVGYSINSKYESILEIVTEKTSEEEIRTYIEKLDAEGIRTFADTIYPIISTQHLAPECSELATSETVVFENMDQGYWLIVEALPKDYPGAQSLVILDTTGSRDISIETKRQEPTLIKHVRDNGMSYGHSADMQYGDYAEFMIRTDVPNPAGYEKYDFIIHDKMAKGLTFDPETVVVHLNEVESTNHLDKKYYTVTYSKIEDNADTVYFEGTSIELTVDIKQAFKDGALKGDYRLFVTYKAILNADAKVMDVLDKNDVQDANPNSAYLEYSNDPYKPGSTATTTPITVYVRTFPLTLKKVDSIGTVLSDAKFVLSLDDKLTEDALDANRDGEPDVGVQGKLIPLIKDGNTYKVINSDLAVGRSDVVYVIEAGDVILEGFDDQVDYQLYELVAPNGYNKLSKPVSLKFFAQYVSNESPDFSDGYPYISVGGGNGTTELVAEVVNRAGSELPSTGGIGTTIFYTVGGLLVVGAVVLLITKKRMSAEK